MARHQLRLDQMMLDALLLTAVHPTKNQSAHQMAQHTTMTNSS